MEFRTYFAYFHTFSYKVEVRTNSHRVWYACRLMVVYLFVVGIRKASYSTAGFVLDGSVSEFMQAFCDLIYCFSGTVSQVRLIIYCFSDWFTFFMISGV